MKSVFAALLPAVLACGSLFAQTAGAPRELVLAPGKSIVLDSPVDIQRVSVADGEVAEAVGISPREVLINGKKPGETSVILWQSGGGRLLFDLVIRAKDTRTATIRKELAKEMEGQDVQMVVDGENVFLRGTVNDMESADRAQAIASTLGKPVNLLNVKIPDGEAQILLKVRFANVDRSLGSDLGINIFSTGATNTIGRIGTGQYSPPGPGSIGPGQPPSFTLSDALNIFLFRSDLNLGVTIKALEAKHVLEILAEPNLLTSNGKEASFLAGGEFPYPVVQGGGGVGGFVPITIQFREFGIKLTFRPTITSRGTIRLKVAPEVSALDYANGFVYQGFTIPGLISKKVNTEIELEDHQSFAIAGLLDNRVLENLSKIPWIGDIPWLGKLFQSRQLNKSKEELLVIVTPELVRPIPRDMKTPEIDFPKEFLKEGQKPPDATHPPRTPGIEVTGPVPLKSTGKTTLPIETLREEQKAAATPPPVAPVTYGLVPFVNTAPAAAPVATPATTPAPPLKN
jgi:pilus assembly protein CpaC